MAINYKQTTYIDDSVPAINAMNLNNNENATKQACDMLDSLEFEKLTNTEYTDLAERLGIE